MNDGVRHALRVLGGSRDGGEGVRTPDPELAKLVLSQLSYTPYQMDLGRVELPTSRLSGVRSNHLSYRSVVSNALQGGPEPSTYWLHIRDDRRHAGPSG